MKIKTNKDVAALMDCRMPAINALKPDDRLYVIEIFMCMYDSICNVYRTKWDYDKAIGKSKKRKLAKAMQSIIEEVQGYANEIDKFTLPHNECNEGT